MKRSAIVLILLIILLSGITIFYLFSKRIPPNPENLTGNSPGNLNNMGLFCEDGDTVYFSNIYDNGCLYSMSADGTNIKKIGVVPVNYLNSGGKYLYYYQTDANQSTVFGFTGRMLGIYRCKKNGADISCLKRTPSGIVSLAGNYIYYQNYNDASGMTLYKLKIDKSSDEQLSTDIVNPASVLDGMIYYNGTVNDLYLHRMNTADGISDIIYTGKVWQPCIAGDNIYYMNAEDNYKIYRYNLTSQENIMLTEDRVDTFNVLGDYIYYQKSSETDPGLMMMNTDGSNLSMVASGIYNQINLTSASVYFVPYNNKSMMYCAPLGSASYYEFTAAKDAIPQK